MSGRIGRLRKLLDLRQKQLDESVGELKRSQERELQAQARVEDEQRELSSALNRRASLTVQAANNDRWESENDWLELRGMYHQAATAALGKAALARQRAHAEVMTARTQLKKMEVLHERLRQEQRRDQERQERRLHDELAQKAASRAPR